MGLTSAHTRTHMTGVSCVAAAAGRGRLHVSRWSTSLAASHAGAEADARQGLWQDSDGRGGAAIAPCLGAQFGPGAALATLARRRLAGQGVIARNRAAGCRPGLLTSSHPTKERAPVQVCRRHLVHQTEVLGAQHCDVAATLDLLQSTMEHLMATDRKALSQAFPEEWPTFAKVSKAHYAYQQQFKKLRALYASEPDG